jgi:hypothetical protein
MASSRRTFLKNTIAGAALGELSLLPAASVEPTNIADARLEANSAPQSGSPASESTYTRGLGIYPGDPREDFGPTLVADETTPASFTIAALRFLTRTV